jgi:predicted nucleic acid-binding protein
MMSLIVDANILIGEVLRQRGRELIQHPNFTIYANERVIDEAQYEIRKRLSARVRKGNLTEEDGLILLELALRLIDTKIMLISQSDYAHLEAQARKRIPRDGRRPQRSYRDDWPTVANALTLHSPLWTSDCDFLGCACPTWTTESLLLKPSSPYSKKLENFCPKGLTNL